MNSKRQGSWLIQFPAFFLLICIAGSDPSVFETTMHRTCGSVAIKYELLYVADFDGMLHCLNAKTGVAHWTHDLQATSWASPLIADNKVFLGDEDGDTSSISL